MAKTRQQKQELLSQYEDLISKSKAIYLATTKLKVNEANDLRKKLKNYNAYYHVVKNTLFKKALESKLNQTLDLQGQVSVVAALDDIVEAAKLLKELNKQEKATYIASVIEGKIEDASQIEKLANLESKEVLLGKLIYLINYPTSGFARALANNIQKLLYVLNNLKDSKNN